MKRPALQIHTTTWAVADMEVVAIVDAESPGLRALGKDVHGLVYTGVGESVPIAFLVTSDRAIKRLRALVGKTVGVKMIGYFDEEECFRPDSLNIPRVKALKKGWFTPRVRSV